MRNLRLLEAQQYSQDHAGSCGWSREPESPVLCTSPKFLGVVCVYTCTITASRLRTSQWLAVSQGIPWAAIGSWSEQYTHIASHMPSKTPKGVKFLLLIWALQKIRGSVAGVPGMLILGSQCQDVQQHLLQLHRSTSIPWASLSHTTMAFPVGGGS